MIEPPAFMRALGFAIEHADEEEAVLRMDVPDTLVTPFGTVHGGVIAALFDTALAVASPCTRATTGWGRRWTVSMRSVQVASSRRMPSRSRSTMSAKSCPAQNTGPAAASTTARVSGSSSVARSAAIRSRMCASESAFLRSGRFMVMVERPAEVVTRMCS